MSTDGVINTVKTVDSDGVTIPNSVTSQNNEIAIPCYSQADDSNPLAEIDDTTRLLGDGDASRKADFEEEFILVEKHSTNDFILVEKDDANDFILVDKPENDLETGSVCLSGEVKESTKNTELLNRLEPMPSHVPSSALVSESHTENQVPGFGVNENQVSACNAELLDEIVIVLDRPPTTATSSYREDHVCRWPNSSDDESSSSDESNYSSDVSSTSCSSSTSNSSGNGKLVEAKEKPKICPKPKVQSLPKTKGELTLKDLPPIQDLNISLPDEEPLEKIGIVYKLVDQLVLIQALKDTRPLDIDSVLFLEGRKPLGQVFDVLGPVSQPFYAVRFNSAEDIANKQIVQGLFVFCAPGHSEVTTYIFTEDLRRQKGSDASWKDNNEPPIQFLDYSDDEEEKKAKQKRKAKSRVSSQNDVEIVHETKLPHTGTSPTGSGRGQRFHGREESTFPPRQVHFATQFRRPPPNHNPFMRLQTPPPPPPVFGCPPTFPRGPPVYGYGNNGNAWPHLPENMGSVDGRSPFGFRFQGSAGSPQDFGHRPPFNHNGHCNPMTFRGTSPYSTFAPRQAPAYFTGPQEQFGPAPPPPPLQNPSFSPGIRQNSNFNVSHNWFRPPPCRPTVPAGLFLPPPPPPPL